MVQARYPSRYGREEERSNRHERRAHRDRTHRSPERRVRKYQDSDNRKRKHTSSESLSLKERDSRRNSRLQDTHSHKPSSELDLKKNEKEFQEKVEIQLEKMKQVEDEEKIIEERRRKRQAIMEKYQKKETVSATNSELVSPHSPSKGTQEGSEPVTLAVSNEEKVNEDFEDIFGSPQNFPNLQILAQKPEIDSDEYGYCTVLNGEILGDRYKVMGTLGKGVFSHVIRAQDTETNEEVAIKVLRDMDAIKRVGVKEAETLQLLKDRDPNDQHHCVRYISHFHDRDFLCIVTKLESHNLKELIDRYGKGSGLPISVLQVYGRQLFNALSFLGSLSLIHADLKPVNILVDNSLNHLRVSDFGSVVAPHEICTAPYLVTGLYRPPEVILGCPYNSAVDIWSAGCILWEMVTGKLLFKEGSFSNNTVLMKHMEIKGPIPRKMIKRAELASRYFDDSGAFLLEKQDPFSGNVYKVRKEVAEPTRNLKEELLCGAQEQDKPKLLELHQLIMKCLELDPNKRITAGEALKHSFFKLQIMKEKFHYQNG